MMRGANAFTFAINTSDDHACIGLLLESPNIPYVDSIYCVSIHFPITSF